MSLPRLYSDLASWWPLLSPPDEDYAAEAAVMIEMLTESLGKAPATILELGSGGGNNALYLKRHARAGFTAPIIRSDPWRHDGFIARKD